MAFVQTQTLEYRQHKDELACLSRTLTLLQQHDVNGAIEILIARQDHLLADQIPKTKEYEPREIRA